MVQGRNSFFGKNNVHTVFYPGLPAISAPQQHYRISSGSICSPITSLPADMMTRHDKRANSVVGLPRWWQIPELTRPLRAAMGWQLASSNMPGHIPNQLQQLDGAEKSFRQPQAMLSIQENSAQDPSIMPVHSAKEPTLKYVFLAVTKYNTT